MGPELRSRRDGHVAFYGGLHLLCHEKMGFLLVVFERLPGAFPEAWDKPSAVGGVHA